MGTTIMNRALQLLNEKMLDSTGLTLSDVNDVESLLRAESSTGNIGSQAENLLKDVRVRVVDGPGYFTTDGMKYFTETYGLTNDQLRGWNITWLNSFAGDISGPIDNFQSYDTRQALISTAVKMSEGETSATLVSELTDIILDQDPILTRQAVLALRDLYSDTDGRYGQKVIGELLNNSDIQVRRNVLDALKNKNGLSQIPTKDMITAFNNPDNGPVMRLNLASIAIHNRVATQKACEVLAAIANGSAFPDTYYHKAKEHGPEAKSKLQTEALTLLQQAPRGDLEAVLPQIQSLLNSDNNTMSMAAIQTISENYSPEGFVMLFNLIHGSPQPPEIQVAAFQGLESMVRDMSIRDDVDIGPNGPAQEIRDIFKSNLEHSDLDVQLACVEGLSTVQNLMKFPNTEMEARDAIGNMLTAEFRTFSDYKKILTTIEDIYYSAGDFQDYLTDMLNYKLNTSPNSDWEIATLKTMGKTGENNAKYAANILSFAQNSQNMDSVKVAVTSLKRILETCDGKTKKQLAPQIGQFVTAVLKNSLPCMQNTTVAAREQFQQLVKTLI